MFVVTFIIHKSLTLPHITVHQDPSYSSYTCIFPPLLSNQKAFDQLVSPIQIPVLLVYSLILIVLFLLPALLVYIYLLWIWSGLYTKNKSLSKTSENFIYISSELLIIFCVGGGGGVPKESYKLPKLKTDIDSKTPDL